MLASEAFADLLSLIILVTSFAALAVSPFSIWYAVKRLRIYGGEGGAKRSYAKFRLFSILLPAAVVVCFFSVGAVVVIAPDTEERTAFLRLALTLGILLTTTQLIVVPIWDRYVIAMAEDEFSASSERNDVAGKLDRAERESEDRYSEGELEKSEVRRRLDMQEEEVKGALDAQEGRVLQKLDAQDAKVSGKLDEMLDILRRGRR